jgi:hypothetical protein
VFKLRGKEGRRGEVFAWRVRSQVAETNRIHGRAVYIGGEIEEVRSRRTFQLIMVRMIDHKWEQTKDGQVKKSEK